MTQNIPNRDVRGHPGTAASVVLLSKTKILLVRQYRPIFGITMLELPGGLVEPGETVAHTAVREISEETGYSAKSIAALGTFAVTVGYSDELVHLFACRVHIRPRHPPPQELEGAPVSVVTMLLEEAIKELAQTSVADLKTLTGLLLYRGRSDEIWASLSDSVDD